MSIAYISLGSNLGDPKHTIRQAIKTLDELPQSSCLLTSSLYLAAPLEMTEQPDFINAVVSIETTLEPANLLAELLAIETTFGRQRSVKNAPRTLDLDLLLYDQRIINTTEFILPHPRMHQRAFVLTPLKEIAPQLEIPGHGKLEPLLASCTHQIITRIDDTP